MNRLLTLCMMLLCIVGSWGWKAPQAGFDMSSRHIRVQNQPPPPSHGYAGVQGGGTHQYQHGHVHGSYTFPNGVNINGAVNGGCAHGQCQPYHQEIGIGIELPF